MFSFRNKVFFTLAATSFLFTGSFVATAQAQQNSYIPPQEQMPQQANVSEARLQKFVQAQSMVSQIRVKFEQQAVNVTSEEQIASLQQQATEQMIQAIQQASLSVDEYNRIAGLVQSDPQLREKYRALVQ